MKTVFVCCFVFKYRTFTGAFDKKKRNVKYSFLKVKKVPLCLRLIYFFFISSTSRLVFENCLKKYTLIVIVTKKSWLTDLSFLTKQQHNLLDLDTYEFLLSHMFSQPCLLTADFFFSPIPLVSLNRSPSFSLQHTRSMSFPPPHSTFSSLD